MTNKSKNKILNSANIVTIVRICLVPIFVVALISPWPSWITGSSNYDYWKPWVALIIFVVLSATDSLDGYLARSRNQVTDFGKFLDPLADKILVCAALIALVELSVLPSWVVLVILMREFIVSGVRMLAASSGVVIAASWYGKAKTVSQIIAIILFILKEAMSQSGSQDIASPLYIVAWIVMIVALILTVVSMFDYCYNAREVLGFDKDKKVSGKKQSNKDDANKDAKLQKHSTNIRLNSDEIYCLSKLVVDKANSKDIKISTAESLTGGLISSTLVNVPGASNVVCGGITSYRYSAKSDVLGIDAKLLNKEGAVNQKVAIDMAKASKKLMKSDIAISSTGVAGPSSDQQGNPVGLVWIGVATKNNCYAKKFNFDGSRIEIRKQTVKAALSILNDEIQE